MIGHAKQKLDSIEKNNEEREKKGKDELINSLRAEVDDKEANLKIIRVEKTILSIENRTKESIIKNQNKELEKKDKIIDKITLEKNMLSTENEILQENEKQHLRRILYIKQKLKSQEIDRTPLDKNETLVHAINTVLKGVHYHNRTIIVLDLVFNGQLFGETGIAAGQSYAREVMKKKFPAWKLCKAKDTAPQGCLNLQGLGQIRCVEELEKGERGLFASKSSIWREGDELLRKVAMPLLVDSSTYHQLHELGDTVEAIYEHVVRLLLEDNGLTDIASKYSVQIGFSMDRGSLSGMTSHIFAGAKSLDIRSKKDGKFIFKDIDENGDEIYCNIQSNTNIYFMKLAYVKDGKLPYELYFKDWFQFIQQLKTKGLPARPEKGWKAVQPVQVSVPQDTSSI